MRVCHKGDSSFGVDKHLLQSSSLPGIRTCWGECAWSPACYTKKVVGWTRFSYCRCTCWSVHFIRPHALRGIVRWQVGRAWTWSSTLHCPGCWCESQTLMKLPMSSVCPRIIWKSCRGKRMLAKKVCSYLLGSGWRTTTSSSSGGTMLRKGPSLKLQITNFQSRVSFAPQVHVQGHLLHGQRRATCHLPFSPILLDFEKDFPKLHFLNNFLNSDF